MYAQTSVRAHKLTCARTIWEERTKIVDVVDTLLATAKQYKVLSVGKRYTLLWTGYSFLAKMSSQ
jgi:hypothetical protein